MKNLTRKYAQETMVTNWERSRSTKVISVVLRNDINVKKRVQKKRRMKNCMSAYSWKIGR